MGVPKIVNVLLSIVVVVVVVVVSSAKGEGESRFQHFFSHFFFFWFFLNSLLSEAALAGKSDFGKKTKCKQLFISFRWSQQIDSLSITTAFVTQVDCSAIGFHHLLGDLDLGLGKTRGFFYLSQNNLALIWDRFCHLSVCYIWLSLFDRKLPPPQIFFLSEIHLFLF